LTENDGFKTINHINVDVNYIRGIMRNYLENNGHFEYDMDDGTVVTDFINAVSLPLVENRFFIDLILRSSNIKKAKGGWLDLLGGATERNSAIPSTTYVVFSFEDEEPKDYDIVIPEGTVLQDETDEGINFITTEEKTLFAGETEININVEAELGGADTNVQADTITLIEEGIDDLVVTNPEPATGGADEEEDEDYRARLLAKEKGKFGSILWLREEALKFPESCDIVINNLAYGKYTAEVLVKPINYYSGDGLINEMQEFLNLDENTLIGSSVFVKKVDPSFVTIDIDIEVDEVNNDKAEVKQTIRNDLKCLELGGTTSSNIKYDGFKIAQLLYILALDRIISNIEGLIRYRINNPTDTVFVNNRTAIFFDEIIIGDY